MPRVTEVIGYFQPPSLVDWKVRVGKRESGKIGRKAMSIGSNVDEWVRAFVDDKPLPKLKTLEAKNCVKAFERWYGDYARPKLRTGMRLYSACPRINGEPDLYWDERDEVVDVKCSRQISDGYWIQTAVYCWLSGKKNRGILRLDKNLADYEYKRREGFAGAFKVFLGLLRAYLFYNPPKEGEGESNGSSAGITKGK